MGKSAFTLAEVLITLGIIGVAAVLTASVIHSKIQRVILNNQFKKMFSTLSIALQKASYDMQYVPECYYIQDAKNPDGTNYSAPAKSSECKTLFYDNIANNLKLAKTCRENSFDNGCVPDYNWSESSSGCKGFSSENIKKHGSLVLNSGGILFLYTDDNNASAPLIGFDVNGRKGPNKPGYDVYSLTIYKIADTLRFAGYSYKNGSSVPITACLPFDSNDTGVVKQLNDIIMK